MLWRDASIEPQRSKPRGEAAISVNNRFDRGIFKRDLGGCRW